MGFEAEGAFLGMNTAGFSSDFFSSFDSVFACTLGGGRLPGLAEGAPTGPFEFIGGAYNGVDTGEAVGTGTGGLPGMGAANDVVVFGFREELEDLVWAAAGRPAVAEAAC